MYDRTRRRAHGCELMTAPALTQSKLISDHRRAPENGRGQLNNNYQIKKTLIFADSNSNAIRWLMAVCVLCRSRAGAAAEPNVQT